MQNLELQSMHYWFKRPPSNNPSAKYSNVLNILQNSIYKTDVSDTINANSPYSMKSIQRPRIKFCDRVILKNVFEHWKKYVIHKLHARKAMHKADYFYHRKLQRKVLNALSKNVLLKWKHIISSLNSSIVSNFVASTNYTRADLHYNTTLLKKYFNIWCKYIRIVHKKNELLRRAVSFYNSYCLKLCLIYWKKYIRSRRQKGIIKDKFDEASRIHNKNILQKYMKAWINVPELKLQRLCMEDAIVHYRNKLYKKYFSAWRVYRDYKIDKMNRRMYIEDYRNRKLLEFYFHRFVMNVNESIEYKIALEDANKYYISKLLQKAFNAWKNWYNKKVENIIKINYIKSTLETRKKRYIFITWNLYIYEKKYRRRKILCANNFYRKKLLSQVLKKFYEYSVYRQHKKEKLSYINHNTEAIVQQLQKLYIHKWKIALYKTMQDKREINKAVQFWQFNLTRKYFFYWKQFSQQFKIKSVKKRELSDLATGYFLKKFIEIWREKLYNILETRKKEMFAVSIMQKKVIRRYLLSWREYTEQKEKFKEDIEAAKELHKKFLLREGLKSILKATLQNIDYRYDQQLKSAAIKSFENIEILKEYFDKWHSLIYLKIKPKVLHEYSPNVYTSDHVKSNCLVLPEYMIKEKSFTPISKENWLEKCCQK